MFRKPRKCLICGVRNYSCGKSDKQIVTLDERTEKIEMKGKLVRIPLGRPGVSIQMYEEEARRKGLLPRKDSPVQTKIRRPTYNKRAEHDNNEAED